MSLSEAAYFAANNMHLWVPAVVASLAGLVIGLGHLVAIGAKDE